MKAPKQTFWTWVGGTPRDLRNSTVSVVALTGLIWWGIKEGVVW